jgi:hypothetical protein
MSNKNNDNDWNDEELGETEEHRAAIKDGQKYACRTLLAILQSVINEQVNAKGLDKSVGSYIFEAVKHEASSKGWIVE